MVLPGIVTLYLLPPEEAEKLGRAPREVAFGFYSALGFSGPKGELVARLLAVSFDFGVWIGVTRPMIAERLLKEHGMIRAYRAACSRYAWRMAGYWLLSVLTLGVAALVMRKPIRPEKKNLPETVLWHEEFDVACQPLWGAVTALCDLGYLQMYQVEGEPFPVFRPTEKLIRMLPHRSD
jgi:hypothetical protein